MYDPYDSGQVSALQQALAEIFKLTCELGGTLTGEHGVGLEKASYLKFEHDPMSLEVKRAIRKLLDPSNILNPAKMGLPTKITT